MILMVIGFVVTQPIDQNGTLIPQATLNTTLNTTQDSTSYDIICTGIQLAPTVLLHECKLIVISGPQPDKSTTIITDFGNVRIQAPLTINDAANVQSNPFATVQNYPAARATSIEVTTPKKP